MVKGFPPSDAVIAIKYIFVVIFRNCALGFNLFHWHRNMQPSLTSIFANLSGPVHSKVELVQMFCDHLGTHEMFTRCRDLKSSGDAMGEGLAGGASFVSVRYFRFTQPCAHYFLVVCFDLVKFVRDNVRPSSASEEAVSQVIRDSLAVWQNSGQTVIIPCTLSHRGGEDCCGCRRLTVFWGGQFLEEAALIPGLLSKREAAQMLIKADMMQARTEGALGTVEGHTEWMAAQAGVSRGGKALPRVDRGKFVRFEGGSGSGPDHADGGGGIDEMRERLLYC